MVALLRPIEFPRRPPKRVPAAQRKAWESFVLRRDTFLRKLTSEVPASDVRRIVARHRAAYISLMSEGLGIMIGPRNIPEASPELTQAVYDDLTGLTRRLVEAAPAWGPRAKSAIQGALGSYEGLVERLTAELVSGGLREDTQGTWFEALDPLVDFYISVAALDTALAGAIPSDNRNLRALARLADKAMEEVEDAFLAKWSARQDDVVGGTVPFDEVLKTLGA